MNIMQPLAYSGMDPVQQFNPFLQQTGQGEAQQERTEVSSRIPSPPTQTDEIMNGLRYAEHAQLFEVQQSGSTSLQIVTNDGDEITISMKSEWQTSAYSGESVSADHHTQYAGVDSYQGYAIQYQVEGELDEGEREALDQLMGKVSSVANEFFSGDMAGTISELENFNLDAGEFSRLSMVMEHRVSYTMAETYQEVSQMHPPSSPQTDAFVNFPALSDFVRDVLEMIDDVNALMDRVLKPEEFVQGLMSQAIERDPRAGLLQSGAMGEIDTFLDQVINHPGT